ncbi:transposase [Croceicoccus naphthovorans]|nr:transposase [Croceicoccus naphthovorans]
MEIPVATPKALLADKGYDGNRFRESLLIRGILPIIPPRSNRKVPEHPDYRRYRDRNRVERMFGKLKNSGLFTSDLKWGHFRGFWKQIAMEKYF